MSTFRQLDDPISTTAWGSDTRDEFFRRWLNVESLTEKKLEVGSFAELAHLVWETVAADDPKLNHTLAPLIAARQAALSKSRQFGTPTENCARTRSCRGWQCAGTSTLAPIGAT